MYKLLNNDNAKSKITEIFSKCEIFDNNKSKIIIVFFNNMLLKYDNILVYYYREK